MKQRKTNKAKQVDSSCGNHGSCPYCVGNRTYSSKKRYVDVEEGYEGVLIKPNRGIKL